VQLNSFTMKILDLPWAPSCCFSERGGGGEGNPKSPEPVMMLTKVAAERRGGESIQYHLAHHLYWLLQLKCCCLSWCIFLGSRMMTNCG
jgi:hypothetical protein